MDKDEMKKKSKEKKRQERHKKFEELNKDPNLPPKTPSFNVCVFGDRIAYGFYDKKNGGWVVQLKLHVQKRNSRAILYNLTVPTDNTHNLLKRFDKEIDARDPKAFVFALGLNDSAYLENKKSQAVPIEDFKKNLSELIFKAKQKSKQILIVGLYPIDETMTSPVPWDHNRFYKNISIYEYNEALIRICAMEKIAFLNIYDELKLRSYRSLLADGLHLDQDGHKYMYEKIKSAIKV